MGTTFVSGFDLGVSKDSGLGVLFHQATRFRKRTSTADGTRASQSAVVTRAVIVSADHFESIPAAREVTLERLGAWDDYVHDVPYSAVQNAVDYEVVDRLLPPHRVWNVDSAQFFTPRTLEAGRITDFRPRLDVGDKRLVFLSKAYGEALRVFLAKWGSELLNDWITVSAGHWGGWEYATFPTVDRIAINEALREARLDWWIGPHGGEAFFRRGESGWEMTSSEALWIQ